MKKDFLYIILNKDREMISTMISKPPVELECILVSAREWHSEYRRLKYAPPAENNKALVQAYAKRRLNIIKRYAGELIERNFPIWKQLNAIREGTNYTNEFAWLDSVREASDKIEEALLNSPTVGDVHIFNVYIFDAWPEGLKLD